MNLQFLSIGQFQGRDVVFFLDPQQQVVHAYPIVGSIAPAQPTYTVPVNANPGIYAPASANHGIVPPVFAEPELPPTPPKPTPMPAALRGVFVPQDTPGASTERRQV